MSGVADDPNQNTPLPNGQQRGNVGERRKSLKKSEVFSHALARLGFPVMAVEAETQQLEIFLQRTFDLYSEYCPIRKFDVVPNVSPAIQTYDLRALGLPFGRGVIGAASTRQDRYLAGVPGLLGVSGLATLGTTNPMAQLQPDQVDLAMRHMSVTRRVYSSGFDWRWEEPVLWLTVSAGVTRTHVVSYEYLQDVTTCEEVPSIHHRWFKDYFHVILKEAVGEVRRKFNTVPGPNAQQLSGADMVREAQEEEKKLREEIMQRGRAWVTPIGPGASADQ